MLLVISLSLPHPCVAEFPEIAFTYLIALCAQRLNSICVQGRAPHKYFAIVKARGQYKIKSNTGHYLDLTPMRLADVLRVCSVTLVTLPYQPSQLSYARLSCALISPCLSLDLMWSVLAAHLSVALLNPWLSSISFDMGSTQL